VYRQLYRPADESLPAVPVLVISSRGRRYAVVGLRGLGWGRISALVSTAPGRVVMTESELRVEVLGATAVRERTPEHTTPPGWFEAVAGLSGRCLVVVIPPTMFGDEDHLITTLREAVHSDTVAAALLPVTVIEPGT
jgi:hypothetical protein